MINRLTIAYEAEATARDEKDVYSPLFVDDTVSPLMLLLFDTLPLACENDVTMLYTAGKFVVVLATNSTSLSPRDNWIPLRLFDVTLFGKKQVITSVNRHIDR